MGYYIAYSSFYTEPHPTGVLSLNLNSDRESQLVNPAPISWQLALGDVNVT
jgi:hypothetical protein